MDTPGSEKGRKVIVSLENSLFVQQFVSGGEREDGGVEYEHRYSE